MQIVAIGGGEIRDRETLPLDRFIVALAGKRSAKALFVPTASGDAEGYCETFDRIYGDDLGCRTDHLLLLSQDKERERTEAKLLWADIVYVGGGNTLRMMKTWRRLGVDDLLQEAGERGAVLAGLSAGAICWHEWGQSESRSFSARPERAFIRVKGLGFCRGTLCPHLDSGNRHKPFCEMLLRYGGLGIACDDAAAVWYRKGRRPVVKAVHRNAAVHLYRRHRGRILVETAHDGEEMELDGEEKQ